MMVVFVFLIVSNTVVKYRHYMFISWCVSSSLYHCILNQWHVKPRNLNQKRTQTRPKAVGKICPSDVAGRDI